MSCVQNLEYMKRTKSRKKIMNLKKKYSEGQKLKKKISVTTHIHSKMLETTQPAGRN